MSDDQLDIMRRAEGAVRIAGRLIVNDNIDLDIKEKGETDFVTKLDFAVQEHLKNSLKAIAPQYSLFSEEKDNTDILSEEKLWILDPVDGTTNLIHNFCHSAISLALADKGDVIGAIVYQPFSGEMFTAFKGKGAFLNGKPISVSSASKLSDSLFSVGTNRLQRKVRIRIFYNEKILRPMPRHTPYRCGFHRAVLCGRRQT